MVLVEVGAAVGVCVVVGVLIGAPGVSVGVCVAISNTKFWGFFKPGTVTDPGLTPSNAIKSEKTPKTSGRNEYKTILGRANILLAGFSSIYDTPYTLSGTIKL
jgi:hypothetical protein